MKTDNAAFPPPGSLLELTVHDLGVDGGAVARHDGGVIFLDRGLPGEKARARLTRLKVRHAFAVVEETLAPSPHERPSFCPHAAECGGCAWTTLEYAAECVWKDRQLRETLRRLGRLPQSFIEDRELFPDLLPSPASLRYRNKMEFAFAPAPGSSGSPRLGLRKRNSREVTEIAECALCARPVGALLAAVRAWAAECGLRAWEEREGFLRFLVIRDTGRDAGTAEEPGRAGSDAPETPDGPPEAGRIVELITAPCPRRSANQEAVRELAARLLTQGLCMGFAHSLRKDAAPVAYAETTRFGEGRVTAAESYGPISLQAPAGAFLQVNSAAAALLYATTARFSTSAVFAPDAARPRVVDLYAGVGGIALSIAALPHWSGASITGIESVGPAVTAARENARRNKAPQAEFRRGDAAALLAAEQETPALLIADPPRAGLEARVIREILRLGPGRVMLVSCNPATLARDAALLAGAYTPLRAQGLDMFPRTPHMEAVLLLGKR